MFHFFQISVFSQPIVSFEEIINKWTQGKFDSVGNVIQADINRAGPYLLEVKEDSTVIFSNPFGCGFGHSRSGSWKVNKADTTITMFFTIQNGYLRTPGTINISEIETYKVDRLTNHDLILRKLLDNTILLYIREQ